MNFDMEQHALKDLTLALFQRCCAAFDFPAGLALQAYLRSGMDDAERIIAWAQRSGRQVTVRLIKGAYWDYEVIHAERMGWPVPVWAEKHETDAHFERMAERFVAAMPRQTGQGGVKLAVGSHNVRSIAYAPGAAGEARPAPVGRRSAAALRHGRSASRGTGGPRAAAAAIRAAGRDDPRHGVPRAPIAREHVQSIVAASGLLRRVARRRAPDVAACGGTAPTPDQPSASARRRPR